MSNVAYLPVTGYHVYRQRPEQERWKLYQQAKKERAEREAAGIASIETYDQFIARVTRELEI